MITAGRPAAGDDATAATFETEMTDMYRESSSPLDRIHPDQVGVSLPDPEELRVDLEAGASSSSFRSRPRARGKWMLVCFSLGLVVVIIVSVIIGFGVSDKSSYGNSSTASPAARKSTPDGVQEYVVARGISSPGDFELPNSPQSMAARWLAMDDRRNEPTPVIGGDGQNEDAYEFVLRYIMAVLYYATKGDSWININFMSPASVCSWNGQLRLSGTIAFYGFGLFCGKDQKPKELYLDRLGLDGELPKEFFKLETLEIIELRLNSKLRGSFPTEICSMPNLRVLSIGFTRISGEIPACINDLVHLEVLLLSNLGLSGQIPIMDNLVKMRSLYLDDNNLVGDITTHFASMPNLQFLILEDNSFTADIDKYWLSQESTGLRFVDLSNNTIRGPFPVKLLELENITMIDLSKNKLTGSISEFPVSNILFLALHENNLDGKIHHSISNLKANLFHLDLSSNGFTGDMTVEIGELVNLTYLFLADNPFVPGPIPDSFQDLVLLEEFSVQRTFRTGQLPEFISTWTSLVLLDLAWNEFVGNIPSPFGDLVQLEFLLLNSNQLSGVVPNSMAHLEKLRAAFLEDNQLTGDLSHICANGAFTEPTGDFDGKEILVADCIEGAGTIVCGCCMCCHPNSTGIEDNQCNDRGFIANLNPIWEASYKRAEFIFGNDTQFIHRDYLG